MDFSRLKAQRASAKSSFTRIRNWFNDYADIEVNVELFKIKYDTLVGALDKYNSIQDTIELIPDIETLDSENRDVFESNAHELMSEISTCIKKICNPPVNVAKCSSQVSNQTNSVPLIKLPEIKIHSFNGKISEWNSFIQLFDALITENSSLSDIQRLIYLKSFLKDEPLEIIESLPTTHENFDVAINLLKNRYENKLSVINAHFSALLEINSISKCTGPHLRHFVTDLKKNLDLLNNLNYSKSELWDLLLIYLIDKKLDFGTRKAFESERDLTVLPDLTQFLNSLEKRCLILENLSSTESAQKKPLKGVSLHIKDKQNVKFLCIFCNSNLHKIYTCSNFANLSMNEKQNFVQGKKLCFNCLGSHHLRNECTSRSCNLCSQKHHTLLHRSTDSETLQKNASQSTRVENQTPQQGHFKGNRNSIVQTQPQNDRQNSGNSSEYVNRSRFQQQNNGPQNPNSQSPHWRSPSEQTQTLHNSLNLSALSKNKSHVLLATALVMLYDSQGRSIEARALLDSASQNSFVTENLVQSLNYVPYNRSLSISGISQRPLVSNKMVELTLYSKVYHNEKVKVSCALLPQITCKLPQVPIDFTKLNIPAHLKLSDPEFSKPSEIDILIGADLYYELLIDGIIRLGKNLPVLQNTLLGWIVAGKAPVIFSHNYLNLTDNSLSMSVQSSEQNLENVVEKFWHLEDVPSTHLLNADEELAEKIFSETTQILPDGSFQVDLPLKLDPSHLGDSFCIAKKRFENLEKKFLKDNQYFIDYKKFINEYIELNHGKIIPLKLTNENSLHKYFLPHHAVIREDSATTKVRVVFDGSCKTTTKLSLNDLTLKGYQVQPDLFDILTRFRSFKHVLTTDIEKMFRQVKINPSHTFLLNILWREHPNQDI